MLKEDSPNIKRCPRSSRNGEKDDEIVYCVVSYLEPGLPFLLLFGLVGIVRAWRNSQKGDRPILLTIALVGIMLLSSNVFARVLSLPLEAWYDNKEPMPLESAEAIVILAGTVNSPLPTRPYSYPSPDTYRRLQHGLWIFRHWKSTVPILVCGGGSESYEPYSQTMRRVLETEGVPANLIWTEGRSRSTHENAVYGSEILRERGVSRIALIVEASSMPRAAASFRKAGMTVVPVPIRFTELELNFHDILPNWQAIALNGETIHELVGLVWYRLRGWI
jgi:uncharacterized SAM-binding protein YcdF (DUF218 family)